MDLAYIFSFSMMHLGNSLNFILVMVKDVWNHLCKLMPKSSSVVVKEGLVYDYNDASVKATVTIHSMHFTKG